MIGLDFIRRLIMPVFIVNALNIVPQPKYHEHSYAVCKRVTEEPNFDYEMLIDEKWRVYYTWNNRMEDICMDLKFKLADHKMISRVRTIVPQYIDVQPFWADGAMFLTMGRSRHSLLVVDPDGEPGWFIEIPHVRANQYYMETFPVNNPKLKIAMKMYIMGRYFTMTDCVSGVTYLLGIRRKTPNRNEINKLAVTLHYGDGWPACVEVEKKDLA